jgi:hypothetical protein
MRDTKSKHAFPATQAHRSQTSAYAPDYSMSFLIGALFVKETVAIAKILLQCHNWQEVATQVADENLLRQRTVASRTRLLREIRYRLQQFSAKELDFFSHAESTDQRHLLFIAVCLRFRFIQEFIDEVLRPKVQSRDLNLYPTDFARFFDRKGAEAPEIDRLTDKSKAKIKQVVIRMLAEGGLIDSTKSQRLQRIYPSRALAHLVAETDASRLRFLQLAESNLTQAVD